MAVNVAEAIIEKDDIYGDGVETSPRGLQAYAEPAGIVLSGAVAEQIAAGSGSAAIDLGDLLLRNLARPGSGLRAARSDGAQRLVGDALVGSEPRPPFACCRFQHQTDP